MRKIFCYFKNSGVISIAIAVALALIILCFLRFRMQVNAFIDADMHTQVEAIQKSSTLLIQNEMNYLKGMTASAAQMISRADIQTEEDILQTLQSYAETSGVSRALFVTLDGRAYTNYAGYLGQSSENTSINGIPLSEITSPLFSQPYYAEDLGEAVFGVISPVAMGEEQGVLVSSYDVKRISYLLDNKFIGGAAEIGVLNSNGEVVSGKNADEFGLNVFNSLRGTTFLNSSVDQMQTDFANGESGFSIYCVRNVSRYCSYAPIGLNDWYVVVMVKESALRGKLTNLERYGLQLTMELVAVMLSLLVAIIASRLREQKKIRMILEHAAMTDGLTGIYNRKATEEEIEQYLSAAGDAIGCALLVIDVDDFKKINDRWGHLIGDNVLKECADRLKNIFGDRAVVGRIGGDEFVVFLRDGWDKGQIEEKVSDLLRNFTVQTSTGEAQKISISVGAAQLEQSKSSFLELYQRADAALYRAKHTGKGRLSV